MTPVGDGVVLWMGAPEPRGWRLRRRRTGGVRLFCCIRTSIRRDWWVPPETGDARREVMWMLT